MKKILFLLLLAMFISGVVYSQKKHSSVKSSSKKKHSTPLIKYGTASFYAAKFNGRKTANGEIYSSTKYTAACNILSFNTWIKVTNIRNKKSVIVRINDRMHPKNKRLIDLSGIAAKKISFSGRGLIRVKIEVLKNFHD
jgi:rare lipoprotein A